MSSSINLKPSKARKNEIGMTWIKDATKVQTFTVWETDTLSFLINLINSFELLKELQLYIQK